MNLQDFREIQANSISDQELVELRSRLGWTQHQLATELGTTQTSVARWESGQTTCKGSNAKLLRTLEHLVNESEVWSLEGYSLTVERLEQSVLDWLRLRSDEGGVVYGYVLRADDGKVITLKAEKDERGAAGLGSDVAYEFGDRKNWTVIARIAASLDKHRVLYLEWQGSAVAVAEKLRQRLMGYSPTDHVKRSSVAMTFYEKDVQYFYDEELTWKLDPGQRNDVYAFRDDRQVVCVVYDRKTESWILSDEEFPRHDAA